MKANELDIQALLTATLDAPIAVIGDVMLDKFVWGNVSRISPEAPVPVVEIDRESFHLGGAANVAQNLARPRMRPLLLGVRRQGQRREGAPTNAPRPRLGGRCRHRRRRARTTVKTRIIAGSQQVVRADWESADDLAGDVEARALDALAGLVREARAVVLSDYGERHAHAEHHWTRDRARE